MSRKNGGTMSMTADMVTVAQARKRAQGHYIRHCWDWAYQLFSCVVDGRPLVTDADFAVPLHPPTEKVVLSDPGVARSWAQSWRNLPLRERIGWVERSWPSVGNQMVPQRLHLVGAKEIAKFASRTSEWLTLRNRTLDLARRWRSRWVSISPGCDPEVMRRSLRLAAADFVTLDASDWLTLLRVIDWLLDHRDVSCYVRELPIRGIDTKWIERHRKVVARLHEAFSGQADTALLLKAPSQIRVRFLDEALAPGGLRDISASVPELDRYDREPRAAIICENLVSVMTLPSLPGVVALHGGGYGVGDLAGIGWLSRIPVLYWGDMDSHGFAILSQWRHHHNRTRSLMMDAETLSHHRDLCVQEAHPSTATIDRLTSDERKALALLKGEDGCLRLEQERIEWDYALHEIREALAGLSLDR